MKSFLQYFPLLMETSENAQKTIYAQFMKIRLKLSILSHELFKRMISSSTPLQLAGKNAFKNQKMIYNNTIITNYIFQRLC